MSEITKKSGIILMLCLILQSSALSAEFAGGTGEPNDPFQIATAAQLVSIGSDANLLDKYFVLINDVDLDPNQPGGQIFNGPVIGRSSSTPFEGALDGNGHNILNLIIDCNTPAGLIGEVGSNGRVYDLGLLGVSISSGSSAGSLAVVNYSSIQDCYVAGKVSGHYNVGGGLGENRGSVTRCYSICEVTGDWYVGGLVGFSDGGKVSHCYTTGSTSGSWDVGGLVGSCEFGSTVTYCYATGPVDGDHDVGGLVGHSLSSYIGWCYASGLVKGDRSVGGLIGFSFGFDEVYSCYFLKAEDGGGPDNGEGTALTLSEMIQSTSFRGWDFYGSSLDGFEDHWFMPPDSPPVLVWQTEITGFVDVPTLVGLTLNEAEIALTNAGFIVGTVKRDYDRSVPADHVILSKPAGYAVAGAIVDIVVSSGAYDWADNPGQGTTEEPYQISMASQLESLANHPELCDKHFILIDDVNMAGRTYQTALIAADANSAEDGFQGTPFTGFFDGNGFVISHLKIEPDVPFDRGFFRANLGLFGKIGQEGIVNRVRLENVQITTGLGARWHLGPIGALTAENEGTISDCSVTGNIIGGQHTFGAGALVGINRGEIHGSYSANGMVVGDSDIGGLVGRNDEGTIVNCYSTISVEADHAVGGLVGTNEGGTLRFCYAAGLITPEFDRSVGGLIGEEWIREGTIINCFWDMETTGQLRSAGGMGLRTDEMKNADIYALNGWAGNSNWIIDDGKDYPRLAWENSIGTPVPEPVVDWLEGTGTSDNPYQIATAEQLSKVAISSVLFDKQFILVTDIDLESVKWHPIGFSPGTEFDGVFDGNDHVISNLNMTGPNGLQNSGTGLFGYTANQAVIKHLILKKITVAEGDNRKYSGALVAGNSGIVKDCHVEATLTGSDCGGLAGENAGLIINCDSTCSISSDQSLDIIGFLAANNNGGSVFASRAIGSITCGDESGRIGGVIGINQNHGIIAACSADVTITCGGKSERIGGLVGFNQGMTVSNSYATGPLNVGGQCNDIGGLVGENWSNIVNCYATGEVVTGNETVDSGGLVGSQGSSGKVTGSYFLSPADGGGPNNGIGMTLTDAQMRQQVSFMEWDFVGIVDDGMIDYWQMPGDNEYPVLTLFDGYEPPVVAGTGTVEDPYLIESAEQLGFVARNPDACYRLVVNLDVELINWTAAVVPLFYGYFDGNGHTIRNLSITTGGDAGLFGKTSVQATIEDLGVVDANISGPGSSEYVAVLVAFNKGTIARCAVTGTVTGDDRVGGLTGENEGMIADCYATCGVTGGQRTGGLVGENNGLITTSYVNGDVSSKGDDWGVGAFVGYNYGGSLVRCIWEKHDGMVIINDICQGLTTEQMIDVETYSLNGWAENPNWVIDSGNDYPRLVWEGTPGEPIPVPTIDWLAGNGTLEDPYRIGTIEQLKLIGTANVFWDKHFILTTDLDCDGIQLNRIGVCPGTGFTGDFDGANHSISNLTLGSDTPRQRNLGLFGYVDSEGSVSSLIMENVQISCGALSGPVAALAAVNQGTIINCGVVGLLNCDEEGWGIGGLIGENDGAIESCYANMIILVGDNSGSIGGLVADNDGHITNSYTLGPVGTGFTARWLGGLVGLNDGPLIHCYAANDVSRKSSPFLPEMGGLVGGDFSESQIVSCYFLGRDNSIGIQISSEQMKMQESFIGWDFVDETENGTEDIWWILENQTYPRLWWEFIED